MSQGKQAFVILKLLLDFSDKQCPILIDQPEDSLDNRAIYNELVQYIKKKKKERQIILVTHNPNVVVSADSELVIVANQHGKDSKNRDELKFQYMEGSLENTFQKDNSNKIVLESQGIREHVCEILEGGKEAFEKREEKYGFK
jgi:predicted ATP-dependent endonuclease of OLD family